MGRDGLLIGEVAGRSGVSRKALRLYEREGILPRPGRTAAGYRIYDDDALEILGFVTQARRLGFRLDQIKEIVALKRSGRVLGTEVRIGEAGNLAVLKKDEWNVLVELIQSGQLSKL